MKDPFWQHKSLEEMTAEEWESLCDGCGRCCLIKLEDADDGIIYQTDVACKLLDDSTCQCRHYQNRLDYVPDCIQLSLKTLREIQWLPSTCAYRLIDEGKPLYPWHPLVSGSPHSVHEAGISVRGKVLSELRVREEDLEDHVINWVD